MLRTIIATRGLAAMLFPARNKAQERVHASQGLSNLKQIGLM